MEQFERFERMVGRPNIDKIKSTSILVLGLGGVGSYALESLIRSGIGKVIIADYDVIDVTNLNRQLMTNLNNIGLKKTGVWKQRIKEINSNCEVKVIDEKITSSNIDLLFEDKVDYIVDACDTIDTKKQLILECFNRNIKLISCMGTGNKMDPSKLKIMDITKTSYDPIARILRKFVKDNKISKKVMVVCSTEVPKKIINPIGSNSFVPATAGLLCTSYIINDIVGDSYDFSK